MSWRKSVWGTMVLVFWGAALDAQASGQDFRDAGLRSALWDV